MSSNKDTCKYWILSLKISCPCISDIPIHKGILLNTLENGQEFSLYYPTRQVCNVILRYQGTLT